MTSQGQTESMKRQFARSGRIEVRSGPGGKTDLPAHVWGKSMARIPGYFEYDDDLTPGQSKDGGLHHNLYAQGRLAGHGHFVPDEAAAWAAYSEDYEPVTDEDDTELTG